MGNIWKKVERGIRYRKHLTRKYSVPRRFDRYYVIRIAVGGVMRQEALGAQIIRKGPDLPGRGLFFQIGAD